MQTVEEIEDLKAERANILGNVENHCPFGCSKGDLDEYGYCVHLVGFTNDRKVMETIHPRLRKDPVTGTMIDTGDKFVSGAKKNLKPVLDTDTLVNPSREAVVEGVKRTVFAWVTTRVYRQIGAESPDKKKLAKAS